MSEKVFAEFNNPDLDEMWANANMLFMFLATAASDNLAAQSKRKSSTKKKKKKVTYDESSFSPGHEESYEQSSPEGRQASPEGRYSAAA